MLLTPSAVQPIDELPATLISLTHWRLVKITGVDARQYLQGQLTVDVNALAENDVTFAAHCDPKGKVWSCFPLYHINGHYYYLQPDSLHQQQLTEFKKYAIFSKVTFEDSLAIAVFGIAGQQAREQLTKFFPQIPNEPFEVIETEQAQLFSLPLPQERFVVVVKNAYVDTFKQVLADCVIADEKQWIALDIAAGYPVLNDVTTATFLPQAINLQALNAISFTKGCYSGQEMVARAKFRGANKRALFWLSGHADELPVIGSGVEMQLGDNWRETGTILAAVRLSNQQIWLQVVLNNDTEQQAEFRLLGQPQSQLMVKALPYLTDA